MCVVGPGLGTRQDLKMKIQRQNLILHYKTLWAAIPSLTTYLYTSIIAKRISLVAMPMMRDSQSGFRAGCSCADQISIMWALMRRALATDKTLYVVLLDCAQAFDTCDLLYIDESLKCHKVPVKLRHLVHAL